MELWWVFSLENVGGVEKEDNKNNKNTQSQVIHVSVGGGYFSKHSIEVSP